jgi:hypothetical protein
VGGSNKIDSSLAVLIWQYLHDYPDESIERVADVFNVSPATTQRVLDASHRDVRHLGKPRDGSREKPDLSRLQVAAVIGLHLQGTKQREIARLVPCGTSTITRILDGKHRYNDKKIR